MASRAGSPNAKSQRNKETTKEFFVRMLTDASETDSWARFLASEDENVALKAFLRAVEYKRGKPVQPTSAIDSGEAFGFGDSPKPNHSAHFIQ